MEHKEVTLETINNGAAKELFQREFENVMRNIGDVSVNSDAPREIVMKFKIKPTKTRESAQVMISCSSKLVSVTQHEASIFLSPKGPKAYIADARQMSFLDQNRDQSAS